METNKKSLSNEVIGALADALGKSFITIQRYAEADDIMLTTEKAKEVFTRFNLEWSNGEALELKKATA